MPAAGLTAER